MATLTRPAASAADQLPPKRSRLATLWRFCRQNPLGAAGGVIFVLFLLCGVFADVLAPYGMNQISPRSRLMAPSWTHWFGTDNLGRDMLSRCLYGAQISVIIAFTTATLATVISIVIGLVTGYLGGKIELVEFHGENALLSPNAAMHLGLAFHELIINAITHGTLLRGGEVAVTSTVAVDDGGRVLTVIWDEPVPRGTASGQVPAAPASRFGRAILERVVPASVGGKAQYRLGSSGVRYSITFPLGQD